MLLVLRVDFLVALFVGDFFDALFVADFFVAVLRAAFLGAAFFEVAFLGTFAPDFLASESPIAIACFLLVTFFPLLPLLSFPSFISCITFSTLFPAFFEYLGMIN